MESVLSLQSITSVEVGHKATPPAHACRLIPKDVELVNRAEFAKEFTKFLLVHRSGNLTDKHLDGVWVRTTVIRPVPHPLPVPHPVHPNFHFAPFRQKSGSPVSLCYSV